MSKPFAASQGPVLVAIRVIGMPAVALLLMLAGKNLALLVEEPGSFAGPIVVAGLATPTIR